MDAPYAIDRTENEKSDEIPKSVDHPRKPCREKFSGDHSRK
jgi:hypothetical protein